MTFQPLLLQRKPIRFRKEWQKHLKVVKETLDIESGDEVVLFSSETGLGKEEAWKAIHKFTKQKRRDECRAFFLYTLLAYV